MRDPHVAVSPLRLLLGAASALAVVVVLLAGASDPARADNTFSLSSRNLRDGGQVDAAQVFDEASCSGGNRSPQLSWRNPPAGTRSFAITIYDPDAPGRGWWHWAVADIPAHVLTLPENASASGALGKLGAIEARNDFDTDGYGGPCPPPGKPHRYVVTVYALNVDHLRLRPGWHAPLFDHEIGATALGSAKLTVRYGR